MKDQYAYMRCFLFHAKGEKYVLPIGSLDVRDFQEKYAALAELWREVAKNVYGVAGGQFRISDAVFKAMMDAVFTGQIAYKFEAATEENASDMNSEPLPFGPDAQTFDSVDYDRDREAFAVEVRSVCNAKEKETPFVVRRMGAESGDGCRFVCNLKVAVTIEGVDRFEWLHRSTYFGAGRPGRRFFSMH